MDAPRTPLGKVTKTVTEIFDRGESMEPVTNINFLFIDLKATMGTYELRSYGGEQ